MKRFLLISDIHAADVDPGSSKAPSYVSTFIPRAGNSLDPLVELEKLIKEEQLSFDCILCAGDLTNKSKPAPFSYAWQKLFSLSKSSGAKLFATVGNHDMDSRYQSNEYDPRGFAMSLNPTIPLDTRQHFLEYWAENFTIVSSEMCNILIINTAAFHGAGRDAAAEIEHGRISDATLSAIEKALSKLKKAAVNILLCHHHVIKPEVHDAEFKGQTRGAEKLLHILSESDVSWIVIHGHKHVPDLFYGHGGSNAPVILGCASFSAQINEDAQNKNPNQVHLLVCDPEGAAAAGLTSAGSVLSWTWQPGVGWRKATGLHGLPYFAGFGHRASVAPLVDAIDQELTRVGASFIGWDAVTSAIPSLRRLIPPDFKALERKLRERGLAILTDTEGSVAQVGRKA